VPLTEISGLAARNAVAIPVSELVWPGPPVTSESEGWRVTRAHASAAYVTPDSWRMSKMAIPRLPGYFQTFVEVIADQRKIRAIPRLWMASTNSSAPVGIVSMLLRFRAA
jgi:hypothetical protein